MYWVDDSDNANLTLESYSFTNFILKAALSVLGSYAAYQRIQKKGNEGKMWGINIRHS